MANAMTSQLAYDTITMRKHIRKLIGTLEISVRMTDTEVFECFLIFRNTTVTSAIIIYVPQGICCRSISGQLIILKKCVSRLNPVIRIYLRTAIIAVTSSLYCLWHLFVTQSIEAFFEKPLCLFRLLIYVVTVKLLGNPYDKALRVFLSL